MANGTKGPKEPSQKRKAKARSPREAGFPREAVRAATYTIDLDWDHSEEDKGRIWHWLDPTAELTGDQVAWALSEITSAARLYIGEAAYERGSKPLPGKVRQQITNLAKSLDQLRTCTAELSEEARATLDSFGLALDGQPVTPALSNARKALVGAHSTISAAADASANTGRPPKEARRNFIKRLAAIWAAVHGGWPRRTGWEDEREEFPFNDFVWECAEPLAGKSGLNDAIREVCEMDPSLTEAILATYVPSKAPRKSRSKKG